MELVIDIEGNGLTNPDKIWVIVCKDVKSKQYHIFRNVTEQQDEKARFLDILSKSTRVIGHNLLGYDLPVLCNLLDFDIDPLVPRSIDTLVVSKLANYSRKGHSVADYGLEFGFPKIDYTDFSKYTVELEQYCIRDVDITELIYNKYIRFINNNTDYGSSTATIRPLALEQQFQLIVNSLHNNGFYFDIPKAEKLLETVQAELDILDADISSSFSHREVLIREFTPKATKYGTISKASIPRALRDNIAEYEIGKTYRHTKLVPFNPASHKQIIDAMWDAGWKPADKTETHKDVERELKALQWSREEQAAIDIKTEECNNKLKTLQRYGWKINQTNLETLPSTAPASARTLAKRILLESRRRTLTEWLDLVNRDSNRIHGKFYGIGAWTHRMAHQNPNTANIPTGAKLYGDRMRALWRAPKNKLLVGVDAEGIQLRIFAHYIDDAEFTEALIRGKKDDRTDPHSLNQRVLGSVCNSRQTAKRFVYALLLGAGIGKLAEILGCSEAEARIALDRLLERYQGFAYLKENTIPLDARRGWFVGLDGRHVPIPGQTASERRHLCMSGYLQNGEAVAMKMACLLWHAQLKAEGIDFKFVDFVHDEWQTEVPNDMRIALRVAEIQADSLRIVGEQLKLKCPLAGSFWNEDTKDYTIGTNWKQTH